MTGAFRVRERFEAVETPLNSTKKSRKARQKPLRSVMARSSLRPYSDRIRIRFALRGLRLVVFSAHYTHPRPFDFRGLATMPKSTTTAKELGEQFNGDVDEIDHSGLHHGLGKSGFPGGAGLFSGLETPMLISTNFRPLRNVSTKLIRRAPSTASVPA